MIGGSIDPFAAPTNTAGRPYALAVLLQLHWFIRLRWVFAAVALGLLLIERLALPDAHRPWQLLLAMCTVALVNVLWTAISRTVRRQLANTARDQTVGIRNAQAFVSAQIAVDLLLLTWILALTGGVENPMALFYLFHVAITGLILRTWQAFLQSCWAVSLYATMCVGQSKGWLAYYPILPHLGQGAGLHDDPEHVMMAVGVVACAVFGTLYFMDRIGKVLDLRQERLLQMNAALEQSQQAIQDLQDRRSRFMQTAAHQLKSPLAMVQTLANLIRDEVVTESKDIQATCDKIARRAREGIVQVAELLALARVQEADPRRHRAALSDVGEAVTELCAKHDTVAEEKGLSLSCQIPPNEDLRARVERADLMDCLSNLIDNAIKYTPAGGRVEIIVFVGPRARNKDERPAPAERGASSRRDDFVYVIVKDTGIGLGESTPPVKDGSPTAGSIFDAFRRGNTALAAGIPGTGLGLSIVREVVEQAGGSIHVYSRPGEGSTFTVSFPTDAGDAIAPAVRDTRSSKIVVAQATESSDGDTTAGDGAKRVSGAPPTTPSTSE